MVVYNNPRDRYVVRLKRAPAFGVEEYSASGRKKALELAASFCLEDPDWVKVVTRIGSLVFNFEQIQAHDRETCKKLGITETRVEVAVSLA